MAKTKPEIKILPLSFYQKQYQATKLITLTKIKSYLVKIKFTDFMEELKVLVQHSHVESAPREVHRSRHRQRSSHAGKSQNPLHKNLIHR